MKKNVLSLSIAAMIGGLRSAQENDVVYGQNEVVPLFDPNATLALTPYLLTQDTPPAKITRVRFRSAGHSDDILDFSVFLSPGETWTAAVSEAARCDLPTLFNPHTLRLWGILISGGPHETIYQAHSPRFQNTTLRHVRLCRLRLPRP